MIRAGCLSIAIALWLTPSSDCRADDDLFRGQIAPILERKCLSCHSGSKPKGGLSLTTAQAALAGGESGAVIEPGKPDESLLVEYISGDKPEMPKEGKPLAADEVAAIREWIQQGAPWPDGVALVDKKVIDAKWWSLEPLSHPAVPKIVSSWIRTPIDAFILASLEENKLKPSPEADRRTMIRRLTFDLHGLPPTPEEFDFFVNDPSADAYENLVDRLLASPRYGERWGRHWLDVVHFGETHGYDKDKPRPNAWPYRDYVIRSLNLDKPYDRFVQEQIAGDVLFPGTPDGVLATGFIAAGPFDFVGHIEVPESKLDGKIARNLDRDDMVMATMSTFVSLTTHCARCHNHKFDPISQEDYYSLQAVFAGVGRADRPFDPDPAVARDRWQLAAQKRKLEAQQEALAAEVQRTSSPQVRDLDDQIANLKQRLVKLPAPTGELANHTLGYHSQIEAKPEVTKWVQVDLGEDLPIEYVILFAAHHTYGGHSGPGWGFPVRFKVEASTAADFSTDVKLIADQTPADFPSPGDVPLALSAPAGTQARYVRVTATKLWERTADFIFVLSELAVLSGGKNVALDRQVAALDTIEGGDAWGRRFLVDGMFGTTSFDAFAPARADSPSTPDVLTLFVDGARINAQLRDLANRREELLKQLLDESTRQRIDDVNRSLADVNLRLNKLPPSQPVYAATRDFAPQGEHVPPPGGKPRPVWVLSRGNVADHLQEVGPGTVSCLAGLDARFQLADPSDEGQRRAALARWLTDPKNSLARRSIVNRIWQYHFGQGIVDTPNDFGRMGSLPSHPQLLDWLAGWFADNGQSRKKLHKLIVTSAVYRQASSDNPAFAKIDGGNRFLWRMNRTRLDAESVRDAMLLATGTLDLTMGGPSVQQFAFKDDHSPVYDYAGFDVDDPKNYRRSVYRFIVRSVPDPFMDCMDCADPSILTPKRNVTLTAIQALAMLNDKFTVRQSEHLAERILKMSADTTGQVTAGQITAGQIAAAYRLTLGREPSATESELLIRYANKHGLANVCRVIFNSNEFMFVD